MAQNDLTELIRATPSRPGVYLMRGSQGEILYVGKASILRNRIASYFATPDTLTPKVRSLVAKVDDFEYILTESEQEALILECNLIKQYKPQYNARLKDDKSYPFIKIDISEDFPQVYITRRVAKDGARYFGPFASAVSVRKTLGLLKKLFPYRSCTKTITGTDSRACLDYFINRCSGPCIGASSKEQYAEIIEQVILFMEGETSKVVDNISHNMQLAADSLEFERAAVLRDQLRAIESVHEGQKVLHVTSESMDVISVAPSLNEAWVEVFFIRQGKLVGRDHFIMEGTQDDGLPRILTAFVKQFYDSSSYIPPRILLPYSLEDTEAISAWLKEKRKARVKIDVPRKGEKRRLIEMVAENASEGLEQLKIKQSSDMVRLDKAISELQEALSLAIPPRRIECFDISNIQGTNPVGSMAVFEDGRPKPSHYRRFKIKSVNQIDDYSMMREVLHRRFRRLAKPDEPPVSGSDHGLQNSPVKRQGEAWGIVPDLVLIDGGKGHLGAALQVFLDLGIDHVPLASLAKENEELFIPQMLEPIILPRSSQGLFLVQRARDEAHRFAVTYHRHRRSSNAISSSLDLVPGIGPKRRRMLLRQFGSVQGIKDATIEHLAAVPGMTLTLASKIKEYL